MKTALIVIDLQQAFYAKAPEAFDRAVQHIQALIARFRQNNDAVIWVQHGGKHLKPTHPDYAFVRGLEPLQGDFRVHKTYGSAFHDGSLKQYLQERGIDTIYLCGFAAENCILSTARGAMDVDIRPLLVKEAVVSSNAHKAACVLEIQPNITVKELMKSLE